MQLRNIANDCRDSNSMKRISESQPFGEGIFYTENKMNISLPNKVTQKVTHLSLIFK